MFSPTANTYFLENSPLWRMRNYDIFVEGKVDNVFLPTYFQLFLRAKKPAYSTQLAEPIALNDIYAKGF